ncbi:helix-turn-helix domain-containing protein [Listeria newyorkensis]|uniref:Helix-turn-helix domain-containing protein n=1 Tax=Listeria newyorkensis TaxID=1497681 RepID=A0A841YXP6_9LIST|nr:helix-turn-helix domain-containing protein [Listeria newyorkensis]MBC1457849.1 helix-turn-helix domain-containing protein [Listeria newyorkensis]
MENRELVELLDEYFLSTKEAIEYLEISRQCFFSLVSRGKISKIKKGSVVLYYRHEIENRKVDAEWLRKKYNYTV